MSFLANRQTKTPSPWNLNWKEWELLTQHLNRQLTGARLERVTVPERPEFAARFIRGDYQLHFSQGQVLWLSLRSQRTALALVPRARRAASQASLPPWVQQATQVLSGMRLSRIRALPEDRLIQIDFGPNDSPEQASLIFSMIPARPWAALLESAIVVQHSLGSEFLGKPWTWEKPTTAPETPSVRGDLLDPSFVAGLEQAIVREAQELAVQNLARLARERLKKLNKLLEHARAHVRSARTDKDQDPGLWATTLLIHAHEQPLPEAGAYLLTAEDGQRLRIPIPETWSELQGRDYLRLARHYTDRARRMEKRMRESSTRVEQARAQIDRLQPLLYRVLRTPESDAVAQLENCLGISTTQTPREISKRVEKGAPRPGFSFSRWVVDFAGAQ